MYIPDHKPALVMAIASGITATVHASAPMAPDNVHVSVSIITVIDEWVRLIGGIAGALAGFASATWYVYSFIAARRKKQ